MNAASLELCKELYELSGWEPEDWYDHGNMEELCALEDVNAGDNPKSDYTPAYDLGYLLRRLPDHLVNPEHNFAYRLNIKKIDNTYFFEYSNHSWWRDHKAVFARQGYDVDDDKLAYGILPLCSAAPEDAACKLAIELFNQGTLRADTSVTGLAITDSTPPQSVSNPPKDKP